MKFILLFSAVFITHMTYAQLPDVIGKDKAIMKVYCDSLMEKLHFTKRSMGKQNDAVLWDKRTNRMILLNYEVDADKLVTKVAILGDTALIEEMQHTIFQGKLVSLEYINERPEHHMVKKGKLASLIFNTND